MTGPRQLSHHGPGHVAVLAGTAGGDVPWPGPQLARRADEWAAVAAQAGVRWLTIRPVSAATDEPDPAGPAVETGGAEQRQVGGCTVVCDPQPDGRRRLAAVLDRIGEADDATVSGAVNAPAPGDPDLIVIAGPEHRLPGSVVWELAYAELVFVDVPGPSLTGEMVGEAIEQYAGRHRRFGGLD